MNLSKGSTVNLTKTGEVPIFKLGASWGKITKKKFGLFGSSSESVDLDLCSFGISNNRIVSECSYRSPKGQYMNSSGDDRSGNSGTKDNEIITLDMSNVPENVDAIITIINSYSGQKFDEIPYAKIRVYEGQDNNPVKIHCEYNIANDETFKGARTLVIGSIFKENGIWSFKAIGETRTYKSIDQFKREVENV